MDRLPARTPEKIAESKLRTPAGYSNLRESVVNDLLPTPKALDGVKGNLKTSEERIESGHQVDLPNVVLDLVDSNQEIALFGTVTTATSGRSPEFRGNGTSVVEFAEEVAEKLNTQQLLPTTTASDWKGPNNSGSGSASSNGIATVADNLPATSWGKFEPAIRRSESVLQKKTHPP